MDDLCALAMLLKWPDLDITGVTDLDAFTLSRIRVFSMRRSRLVLNACSNHILPEGTAGVQPEEADRAQRQSRCELIFRTIHANPNEFRLGCQAPECGHD